MTPATHATSSTPAAGAAPDATCPAAAAGARLLEQCERLVSQLSDEAYRAPSAVMAGGTIGQHLRHTLDHFAAVAAAADNPSAPIDYDHRRRGVPVETDRAVALAAISGLAGRLRAILAPASATPVAVRVMLAEDGAEATLASTLGRELAFAAHHAVHHHAMIKAIAQEHGERCPGAFGKAPSTLHHEQSTGQGAEAASG